METAFPSTIMPSSERTMETAVSYTHLFRGGHPLGSFIIVVIVVDVVAGIGVPQGKIQIAPGLLLRELSLTHTVPDPLV